MYVRRRRSTLIASAVIVGFVVAGIVLGPQLEINPGKPTCSLCAVGAGVGSVAR